MILKTFAIYDVESGAIRGRLIAPPAEVQINRRPGEAALPVEDQSVSEATHYILGGQFTPRPIMGLDIPTLAVGVGEPVVIDGVPPDTTCYHPDGVSTIDDGQVEWSATLPGRYQLRFENFPYRDAEVWIEVTP